MVFNPFSVAAVTIAFSAFSQFSSEPMYFSLFSGSLNEI
jgi:hypothetical protein